MATNDNTANTAFVAGNAYLYPSPGPVGARGPKGDPGPPGPAGGGPALLTGPTDPPDFIEGAKPGDTWLNTVTGDTFTLT